MLNDKAREIYQHLLRYAEEHGYPPTIREIGDEFGIRSTNGVRYHLNALEQAGYIRRNGRISRGIELLGPRRAPESPTPSRVPVAAWTGIPILGRVAAGSPMLAEENLEGHLTLEEAFPERDDLFCLRVNGPSMRDLGILSGDLVVVRQQEYAREGDAVVAVMGEDATVKTYRRTEQGVELHPANPDYSVIRIPPGEDFRILGVVIGLVRPPSALRRV